MEILKGGGFALLPFQKALDQGAQGADGGDEGQAQLDGLGPDDLSVAGRTLAGDGVDDQVDVAVVEAVNEVGRAPPILLTFSQSKPDFCRRSQVPAVAQKV